MIEWRGTGPSLSLPCLSSSVELCMLTKLPICRFTTLAEAQRLLVDAGQALPSNRQIACGRLVEATAGAGPYHALPGACPLTGAGVS